MIKTISYKLSSEDLKTLGTVRQIPRSFDGLVDLRACWQSSPPPDKLDTICACFGIGLVPTGTADPYALRRQAIGIVQIMLARGFSVSLEGLIRKSMELLRDKISETPEQIAEKVLVFFQHLH